MTINRSRSLQTDVGLRALVLLGLVWLWPQTAVQAGGWVAKAPPHVSNPDSGRRNHLFYVGDPVKFDLPGQDLDRYEVRDYWGRMIDKGPALPTITIKAREPGWYKLYIYARKREPAKPKKNLDTLIDGDEKPPAKEASSLKDAEPVKPAKNFEEIWGDIVGGTTFVIFRKDANFPPIPAKGVSGGGGFTEDQVMRAVTGMGPQRYPAYADKPEESIKTLGPGIAIDKESYLPRDPLRERQLFIAFPNGTKNAAGVRQVVEHFKADVKYWEPRNEPNGGSNGTDFANNEMQPFYDLVKSIDPNLKVLGPGTVSVGPQLLPWIEDFLKAGGAKHIDAFSFHAYNNVNGDLWLARKSMETLKSLLGKNDAGNLEKWQTEQGFFACVYGAYQPRLQGRWTMLEMMVFEQYGIPKEHNHLWYDKSHGFWDFPTWWENDDGSLNPAAPLMRVWSEELFGTKFSKAFDFGEVGNKLYIGSLFSGPDKQVAALMSAGSTDGQVELAVSGGDTLKVSSAFGVVQDVSVKQGRATLTVPELPIYVELAKGQTIEVVPPAWGPNLARTAGTTALSSGAAEHPLDKTINNDIGKIVNGELENWYWSQKKDAQPWMSNVNEFPAWVEIQLPKPQEVTRVVVYAAPPWQWQGSLLDYELQFDDAGTWKTLDHVQEPPQTFQVYTPPMRTSVDSFYSDRWIFQHQFQPVTTARFRLLVHECTWGGGATEAVGQAGGQTGPHQIMSRD